MKKVERRGQTWTVYTKEEFLEREDEDLAVAKHGESLSDADYVESVDGYVVPVIKTYYLSREPERLYYVTPYGSYFPFTGRGVLSTDPDEFVSGLKNPKNEKPLTDKQKHFAILYARTRKRAESYKKAYGVNWRMEILRNEADKLLKKKKVQDYVDELTAKAMAGIGVDHEWVLNELKSIISKTKSDSVKLSTLKEFIEILGMKKTNRSSGSTMILPMSESKIDKLLGEPTDVTVEYEEVSE